MSFNIYILGSNSALPMKHRNPSAHLINIGERSFLVDCGEGTQMQMQQYDLKASKISKIFISHLHGDHYFGLIGLISTFHLYRRTQKLEIYAPPLLEQIILIQLQASNTKLGFELQFFPISEGFNGTLFEDEKILIESFPLDHRIATHAFIFRQKAGLRKIKLDFIEKVKIPNDQYLKIKQGFDFIDENGMVYKNRDITSDPIPCKSYAYCSDTKFDENIVEKIKNVTLLYHEATFADDNEDFAKEKFHSTARQAATIAKKAKVKQLIIGHFSTRYPNINILLNEAQSVFPNTVLAKEGNCIEI